MENPMWGGNLDDENTLHNLINLPPSSVGGVVWPPTPTTHETNEEISSSPFSEFFLTNNSFSSESCLNSSIFVDANIELSTSNDAVVVDSSRHQIVDTASMFCHGVLDASNGTTTIAAACQQQSTTCVPTVTLSGVADCAINNKNDAVVKVEAKKAGKLKSSLSCLHKISFKCDLCIYTSQSYQTLMVHKRSKHAGEKSFQCNDCLTTFTRLYSLKRHVLQKHQSIGGPSPQLPKYCPFPSCSYVTRNANSMQIHKRSHNTKNVSMYYCKQCKCRYSRRQSLLKHLTQKHSSNAALIGIITTNAITLVNNSVVASTSGASNAIGNGNVVRETVKSIDCHDRGVVDDASNGGVVIVADDDDDDEEEENRRVVEKLYKCDKCQFTSGNFLDVYRHKQSVQHVVDDENGLNNKNVCLYCHKKLSSSNGLLTHIKKQHLDSRQKTTVKLYQCTKCSFSTRRKKVLKAHEDNTHFVVADRNNQICYTVGAPVGRSPPKSDRNSVNSDGIYVNFGTNSTGGSQIFSSAADLQSTPDIACCQLPPPPPAPSSAYGCMTSSSASVAHDALSFASTYPSGPTPINGNANCGGFNATAGVSKANNAAASTMTSSTNLNSFDELAFSMQHVQQANCHLLNLCRRRENELNSLRTNVLELLKRIYPNFLEQQNANGGGCVSLENVDQFVVKAINDCIFR